MRIKHYGIFHNNLNTLNWESLRNSEVEKPYYLPYTKEDYLSIVETDKPSCITQLILQEINKSGFKKIFSIGSGVGYQEYQLKKFSELKIVVSDYNSSILRLKEFNIFDDALIIDALKDPLPIDESWAVLFPRIDTEFDDNQLRKLIEQCHNKGVDYIYFIPTTLLSLRIILGELKTILISIIKRKKPIFCGYIRSLSSHKKIWNPYYKLSIKPKNNKLIFFLHSK